MIKQQCDLSVRCIKRTEPGFECTHGFKPLHATSYFCSLWSFLHLSFSFFKISFCVMSKVHCSFLRGLLKSQVLLYFWFHCVNVLLNSFPFWTPEWAKEEPCEETPAVYSSWSWISHDPSLKLSPPALLSTCQSQKWPSVFHKDVNHFDSYQTDNTASSPKILPWHNSVYSGH